MNGENLQTLVASGEACNKCGALFGLPRWLYAPDSSFSWNPVEGGQNYILNNGGSKWKQCKLHTPGNKVKLTWLYNSDVTGSIEGWGEPIHSYALLVRDAIMKGEVLPSPSSTVLADILRRHGSTQCNSYFKMLNMYCNIYPRWKPSAVVAAPASTPIIKSPTIRIVNSTPVSATATPIADPVATMPESPAATTLTPNPSNDMITAPTYIDGKIVNIYALCYGDNAKKYAIEKEAARLAEETNRAAGISLSDRITMAEAIRNANHPPFDPKLTT